MTPSNKEMFSDPEPPDEDSQEWREEMFETHHAMGDKPQDLTNATPEFREQYTEWLKQH